MSNRDMIRIRPVVPLTAAFVLGAIAVIADHHEQPAVAPAIAIDDSVATEMRSATTEREPNVPPRRPRANKWKLKCTSGPYRWLACVDHSRSTDGYDHLALDCTTDVGRLGSSDYAWDGEQLRGWNGDVLGCNAAKRTTRYRDGDTSCIDNAFEARSALNICPLHVVETLCVSATHGLVGYRLWAPSPPEDEIRCGEVPADAFPLQRAQ
jgi:hypothetical protein